MRRKACHEKEGHLVNSQKPWLQYYREDIPPQLEYDEKPLHYYLKKSASQYPNKIAIHFLGKEFTFQYIYDAAERLACYLQDIGLLKGDRVAIMLPNTPQAVISFYAVLMAGGIVVQTNPLYTERELEYQMIDSGAKAIITLDLLYPRVPKF